MKTFRMIGMAMFAVLMCVNFAACSGSDNDEPEVDKESGVVINEKKLVEMKIDEGIIIAFTYDDKDKLVSAKGTEIYNGKSYIYTYNYIWGNNIIKHDGLTFTLADGLIQSTDSSDDKDLSDATFTYNSSKQLTSFKDNYNESISTFVWSNNKITKKTYESEWWNENTTIEYSDKTCKGYFPLMAWGDDMIDDNPLFLAHPELVGMRNNLLPIKIYSSSKNSECTTEISYTFTKDGYIESCTSKETEVDNDNTEVETTIYTFKWE